MEKEKKNLSSVEKRGQRGLVKFRKSVYLEIPGFQNCVSEEERSEREGGKEGGMEVREAGR